MTEIEKHVVIVGAGFAGLQAAKKLGNRKNIKVTVIDKNNHHLFQPLLYQVASSVLSPADIAIPTRSITTGLKNVSIIMAEVKDIHKEHKKIHLEHHTINYDYLILAMGAKTSYFGNDHWKKFAPGMKNLNDALKVRKKILLSFEQAELEQNPDKVSELLNYIIIGGGPTGVELAGAIAELSHQIIKKDFRYADVSKSEITLIEAGPRILPTFSEKLSLEAKSALEKRGVKVLLNTRVANIDEEGVHTPVGVLRSHNIVWAAGVAANSFTEKLKVELDRSGRVIVDEFCSIKDFPEIFVIGDMANFSKGLERPLPGVSPVAMQQGRYIADLIVGEMKTGKREKPFQYYDKGSMATIGRMDAVAQAGNFHFSGLIGWLMWLLVHLFYQVGFKNKVSILLTWIWSYISFKAGARLIQMEEED